MTLILDEQTGKSVQHDRQQMAMLQQLRIAISKEIFEKTVIAEAREYNFSGLRITANYAVAAADAYLIAMGFVKAPTPNAEVE